MARTGGYGFFPEQKPEKSSDNGCNVSFMPAETLSDGKKRKSNKNRLRVRRVVHVPLREVSGICLRRGRNGRMFLIAVGDRVAKIAWFSEPRNRGRLVTEKIEASVRTDLEVTEVGAGFDCLDARSRGQQIGDGLC